MSKQAESPMPAQAGTKLSVLMTVYNEADFVEYAIRAALPYVDDLVIVEGAYQETIACGAEPRSTDDTIRKIQDAMRATYPDDPVVEKIKILTANEKTDKDQRNLGLAKIKELNPDGWLLIIDGDEVYTKENIEMVRNFMRLMDKQDKRASYFTSLTFVNDFQHYTEQEFPRLFKITPECKFVDDNFMVWKEADWSLKYVMKLPFLRYHHYAFCKSKERFELKKKWWETRFPDQPDFDYGWHVKEDGEIDDPGHPIQLYGGQHPEIMKTHPMYPEENDKP